MRMNFRIALLPLIFGLLVSPNLAQVFAQTTADAPPSTTEATGTTRPPAPKLNAENLRAIAMIGAAYNSLMRASSYRGKLRLVKTIKVQGKPEETRELNWTSAWLNDGEGNFTRRHAEGEYQTTIGQGTAAAVTKDRVTFVEDGKLKRNVDPERKVWSEREQPQGEADMAVNLILGAWTSTLMFFHLGAEFTISEDEKTGQVVIAGASDAIEMVFDTPSGNLRSWQISGNNETTMVTWRELELNLPLPPTLFQWTPPAGMQQVPPEQNRRNFSF